MDDKLLKTYISIHTYIISTINDLNNDLKT